MKKGIARKLVCILMGVLSTLFLVSCGSVKLTGIQVSTSDELGSLTAEISQAHNDYISNAQAALAKRGVLIATDVTPANKIDVGTYLTSKDADIAEVAASLNQLSSCVFITTGKNYQRATGTMTINIEGVDDPQEIGYKFFYGGIDAQTSAEELTDEWILWLDLEDLDLEQYGADTNDTIDNIPKIMGELFKKGYDATTGKGENGEYPYVSVSGKAGGSTHSQEIVVAWSGMFGEDTVPADDLNFEEYDRLDPVNDVYGAYGLDVTIMQAAHTGDAQSALMALMAMTSPSAFLSPSNYAAGGLYWEETTVDAYKFIRRNTDTYYLSDISGYSPWTWTGANVTNKSMITAGHEVISSTVVDYGRIYTLDVNSAENVAEIQKLLYNTFGKDDQTSLTVYSGSVSGNDLAGTAGLDYFKPTDIALVPPGFGILCYSFIPSGMNSLGDIDIKDTGVGVIFPAGGMGTDVPSLGLGFLGPNEMVIDGMNEVLNSGGGGFAILNDKVYLMAYPVSAVNYLYTDPDTRNAYLGIGPTPVYYNLIYDRLDYKYGEEYQFMRSANIGLTDTDLYSDFNFVGGISYKDATTDSYASVGGVGLLVDDAGKPLTCKLQIAPDENIEKAKEQFTNIVDNYWVQPVPLKKVIKDGVESSGIYIPDSSGVYHLAEDWLTGTNELPSVLNVFWGTPYFQAAHSGGPGGTPTAMNDYLEGWATTLHSSYLEVPQFLLLNYVESTLLPGAAGQSNVAVTGRKIHLLIDAIKYDSDNNLFYFPGNTSTRIGEYVSTDGTLKVSDLYLGDIVDVRSLCGAGYTQQYHEDEEDPDFTKVQPPYGFNALFPIGTEVDVFMNRYEAIEKNDVDSSVQSWVDSNLSSYDIKDLYTMSHWNGNEAYLGLKETGRNYTSQSDYTSIYSGIGDTYYQSASVVNNVGALTHKVTDGVDSSGQAATSIVSCLNVTGADMNAHLGTTTVTGDTLIEDLPYVSTDIITFSEPFPNTMFQTVDAENVFKAGSEVGTNTALPNVMFTVAVGTGITKGNFYNAWVISDAPTDSLNWWNNYLGEHGFTYNVKAQTIQQYIDTNYSYLANEGNRLRVDMESVEYWSETLDVTNPAHGGNFISNIIMTASNIVGVFCVFYSIICLLLWAVDIYAGFDKDFYRMVTGGRYIASAERLAPVGKTIYATFPNALGRSTVICVAGLVLIFVGAGTLLALMFRFVAVILRIIFRYWN